MNLTESPEMVLGKYNSTLAGITNGGEHLVDTPGSSGLPRNDMLHGSAADD